MPREKIEEVMDVVNRRFADYQFTVESLAQEAGISISHLREIVHVYYGMSPHGLIETIRLEEATMRMLRDINKDLYCLCREVGYGSYRAFLDAFEKRLGIPPRDWRMRIRGDGNGDSELEETVAILWGRNSTGENRS